MVEKQGWLASGRLASLAHTSVVDSYNYDVFGRVRSSTGSQANPFTFTGEQTDTSTGLEYLSGALLRQR